MVALFNTKIVIGDHNVITTYHRTDNGSRWQFNILHQPTNYTGGRFVSVGNGFDGFGNAAA